MKNSLIPLFYPHKVNRKVLLKELNNTLDSRWYGQGPKVDLFEKKFGEKFGYRYPLFLNSCTAALELAYHLIGLKEGDEVIVPVLNCTAGQTGLLRRGVKIIFADIDNNLTISYEEVKKKITPKTKAIVVVHLGGIEADKRIYQLAKRHNIPCIVDSAQYLARSWGDYICYSFQAIKHITTGDGGLLVCSNAKDYLRAKKLRWFGIDREQKAKKDWQAWQKREMTFDIEEAGYKYQPTDIDASLGLVGLQEADYVLKYRQHLADMYMYNISSDVSFIAGGTNWLFGILTDYRDELAAFLKEKGIETNLCHLRNDIFKVFGGKRQKLPMMDKIESKYLYLPLNTHLKEKDILYISSCVNELYKRRTS